MEFQIGDRVKIKKPVDDCGTVWKITINEYIPLPRPANEAYFIYVKMDKQPHDRSNFYPRNLELTDHSLNQRIIKELLKVK